MSKKGIFIPVKCIARRVDTQWDAICMTLDIAVQGDTFEEVQANLEEAICMYLESFEGLEAEEFLSAIKRPVPNRVAFGIYAEIIWHSLKSMFSSKSENETKLAFYPTNCLA